MATARTGFALSVPVVSPAAPLPIARVAAAVREIPVSVEKFNCDGIWTAANPVLPVWAKVSVLVGALPVPKASCIDQLSVTEALAFQKVPLRFRIGLDTSVAR